MKQTSRFPNLAGLFSKTEQPTSADPEHMSALACERNGITWIDIQDPDKQAFYKIAKEYSLHELHIAQCFQKGHIAQVNVEEKYIFATINFPYYIAEDNRIASGQLNIFVGRNFLITIHGSNKLRVRELFEIYRQNPENDAKYGAEILYHLIEELLQDTASIIQNVFRELDETEDAVFDDKSSDGYAIGQLRQKIIALRRTLTNQSKVLDELGDSIRELTEGHLKRHFKTNANVSRKLWEATDEAKEVIEIYKDVDFTSSTAKTNEILAVLTLLFTLTIPATVLGTFYGMNILLPGGIEAGSWTFLGDYTMIKMIVSISVIGALTMYIYFKQKKWF